MYRSIPHMQIKPALRIFWNTKMTNEIFKTFLKLNWLTGSPPKFDTLLASWYPTYMQSFLISHSSCADQYGDMSADTHIHTYTNTPRAGVQLVSNTSINISYCVSVLRLRTIINQSPFVNNDCFCCLYADPGIVCT